MSSAAQRWSQQLAATCRLLILMMQFQTQFKLRAVGAFSCPRLQCFGLMLQRRTGASACAVSMPGRREIVQSCRQPEIDRRASRPRSRTAFSSDVYDGEQRKGWLKRGVCCDVFQCHTSCVLALGKYIYTPHRHAYCPINTPRRLTNVL